MSITGISALSGTPLIAAGAVSAREAARAAFTTDGNSLQGLYNTVSNNSAGWNDAYYGFVQTNSYDNPGWETVGITTANPFGFKIDPTVAYDNVSIVASRLITRKVYGPWYELDLSFAFSGNPKDQYGYYNNFATLDSGHFGCPFTAQSQDDWNNVGGNLSYIGIYGTEAHYTTFDPYNKTATQVINLKTTVMNV
jgi:hypothetical protein